MGRGWTSRISLQQHVYDIHCNVRHLTHWGPSLRAFWPRLSKLYSVLGLPLALGVLGRVVSAKGF